MSMFLNRYRQFNRQFKSILTMSKASVSDYGAFKDVLNKSKYIVVLTGAGISAESGIPVFRGEGGLWRTHQAAHLATPTAFRANPSIVWEFYHYRREVAFAAEPNKAHVALALLEKKCKSEGKQYTLVTQNVDGLHNKAGSESVLELHGSLRKVKCTKCGKVEVNMDSPICEALSGRGDPNADEMLLPTIQRQDLPKCKHCKAMVRPHIVWFGEQLEVDILEGARNAVENCDLCLIIGTSSVVYPAAMFAPLVAERGHPVAEFNINQHPASDSFKFHFSGPCATTLPKALGVLDEINK